MHFNKNPFHPMYMNDPSYKNHTVDWIKKLASSSPAGAYGIKNGRYFLTMDILYE